MLTPEVLTIFILNALLAFFASIVFVLSFNIYRKWDKNSLSQLQYKLEKQSYLAATIIKFIFILKIPLFLFFVFTLDKLSDVLTGAMCAAGVVDATVYGTPIFVLKIINLYIFAYWIVLNNEDIKHENQPLIKQKFALFLVAYFLFMTELVLEGVMFSSIEVDKIVSCCGTLYSSASLSGASYVFTLSTTTLLSMFYTNLLIMIVLYFYKNRYIFAITNLLFIIISLVTLILFFGTYIYELPSHHCPFCFLQGEYYYVGYLIYTLLFLGTFYGMTVAFLDLQKKQIDKYYQKSIIFNTLYVILVSLFVVVYYMKNGVLL